MVPPAGQEFQAAIGLLQGLGFRQDAAADGHDRVGAKHEMAWLGGANGLFARQAFGMRPGQFAAPGSLVDILWRDAVGRNADLGKKGKPAGACGGQNEFAGFGRQDRGALI